MIRLVLILVAGFVAVVLARDEDRISTMSQESAFDIETLSVEAEQENVAEIVPASPNVGTVIFSTSVAQQSIELIQLGSTDAP